MANEFKHASVGTSMTQAEFEAVGGHVADGQTADDILYFNGTYWVRLAVAASRIIAKLATGGLVAATLAEIKTLLAVDVGEGHILILPYNYSSIGQGTWAIYIQVDDLLQGVLYNSTHADADNISYKVYLQAGTYTLTLLSRKTPSSGILDFDIDSTEIASLDLYNAVTAIYNQLSTYTNISIATSGLYTLKARVHGKNAGSDNYFVLIQSICLWRTA